MLATLRPERALPMQRKVPLVPGLVLPGLVLTSALVVGCTQKAPTAPDNGTKPAAAATTANAAPTLGVELAEKRNAEIIQNIGKDNPAAGTDARKIADYYAAYMNDGAIESKGLSAIDADLKAIDDIADKTALSRALGEQVRADTDPLNSTNFDTEHLFGVFVAQSMSAPDTIVPYVMQGGLGMPGRDYYLAPDKEMQANRAAYQAYVQKLLELSGTPDAAAKAKSIFDLETKIANAQSGLVDSEDVHKANNPWAAADWAKKAPGIDWPVFFEGAGLKGQPIVFAWQPEAIAKLSKLVASEPLQTW